MNYEPVKVEFKGKITCDTLDEVEHVKKKLGDIYIASYKCKYPDITFYIVEFKEE